MSSDPPIAGRSSAADEYPVDSDVAVLVRLRGAPLLEALDERVAGARKHADATGSFAFATAVGMGLDRSEAELCREAAKLHDVGKVYVPTSITSRPLADMAKEEREALESHHEAGARLALGAGVPEAVCEWILNARERFDGTGPAGLRGPEIPVGSRVTRAACACDLALHAASSRPGDPAELQSAVMADLRSGAGRELDPEAVAALAELLEGTGS